MHTAVNRTSICTKGLPPGCALPQIKSFLLEQATAPYVLYADDDLLMEPWVVDHMLSTIQSEGCGFVGMADLGASGHASQLYQHFGITQQAVSAETLRRLGRWQSRGRRRWRRRPRRSGQAGL